MAKPWHFPVSSGVAGVALVFSFMSVHAFLGAAAVAPKTTTPHVTVNHFRKGDRLPLYRQNATPPELRVPDGLQTQQRVPLGCDRAFSPVSSPSAANVYGRCIA